MPDGREQHPTHPGLPAQWPSAFPSVRKQVFLGAIIPIVAAVVVAVVLMLTSSWSSAWWVALLPLLLLVWPLSLPARVRSAMQHASDSGDIDVTVATLGVLARARKKRLGVRPSAEILSGYDVRYHLGSSPE